MAFRGWGFDLGVFLIQVTTWLVRLEVNKADLNVFLTLYSYSFMLQALESVLLEFDSASLRKRFLTFRGSLLASSSWVEIGTWSAFQPPFCFKTFLCWIVFSCFNCQSLCRMSTVDTAGFTDIQRVMLLLDLASMNELVSALWDRNEGRLSATSKVFD